MADKPKAPPIKAPVEPVVVVPPVDAGLVAWRSQLQGTIASQAGVEDVQGEGGSLHFRFRGQTFMVSIVRTS